MMGFQTFVPHRSSSRAERSAGPAAEPTVESPAVQHLVVEAPHSNFRTRVWSPTLEQLGLPRVGLHVLRHSAAARMISAPKAIQTVLGHGSVAFRLTVYGHVFDATLTASRSDSTSSRVLLASCRVPVLVVIASRATADLRQRSRARRDSNPRPAD